VVEHLGGGVGGGWPLGEELEHTGLVADESPGEVVPGRLDVADDLAVGGEDLEDRLAVEAGRAEEHGDLEVAVEDLPKVRREQHAGEVGGGDAGGDGHVDPVGEDVLGHPGPQAGGEEGLADP
jgi:hypothetical protein